METANVISVVALAISIVSGIATWRLSRQQNSLAQASVELERVREADRIKASQRARLVASIVKEIENWTHTHVRQPRTDYFLRIANEGAAEARNVRLLLDHKPAEGHAFILKGDDQITHLGPGADARLILAVTFGAARTIAVELSWQDDSGEMGRWGSQLKI